MIVNKFWRIMNWHVRMLVMTVLCGGLIAADCYRALPALHLFAMWVAVVWVGTAVRYIFYLLTQGKPLARPCWNTLYARLGQAWAVAQTFTFITFTRLFFRSGSNLDPATANQEAWHTATMMVNQIGGAWNSAIIPSFLYEYRVVVGLFVAGMLIHWLPAKWKQWYRIRFATLPLWVVMVCIIVSVFVIYQFVTADMQPFIYFQF